MLVYILYTIFFIACIVLVGAVLLQPGKTDAGALFTSNVSSSSFGPRGTATVLSKLTIAAAAVFMLTALLISMPALTGSRSVLTGHEETPAEAPATTDANSAATNANVAVPVETNSAQPPASNPDANAAQNK